jgi:intracellular septation protein
MPIFNFLLSFFIEFGSVVGFLLVAYFVDFFTGVKVLMFLTVLAVLFSWMRDRRIPVFALIVSVTVLVFGGLSLYFTSPYFIVFEYTAYNFVFAFFAYYFYFQKKALMKILFSEMFSMTEKGWEKMSLRWANFFIVTGILNEIIWWTFGEKTWLEYRAVVMILSTFFAFYQFTLSKRERLPEASKWGLKIF